MMRQACVEEASASHEPASPWGVGARQKLQLELAHCLFELGGSFAQSELTFSLTHPKISTWLP